MDDIAGAMMKLQFYIPLGATAHCRLEVMQARADAR
jgi:hypothetical protein